MKLFIVLISTVLLLFLVFNDQKQPVIKPVNILQNITSEVPKKTTEVKLLATANTNSSVAEEFQWFATKYEILQHIIYMNEQQEPLLLSQENRESLSTETTKKTVHPTILFKQLQRFKRSNK